MVLGLALTLTVAAHAEDVSKRAKVPSSTVRVRGAVGLKNTPSGLFAMGGSRLRHLAPGAKSWNVLLNVKGENLYRLAENGGRVLAPYENEPHFHLIDLRSGAPKTIAKPSKPAGIEGLQERSSDRSLEEFFSPLQRSVRFATPRCRSSGRFGRTRTRL